MWQTLFTLSPGLELMTGYRIPRIRKAITQEQYDVIKILYPLFGRKLFHYRGLDEAMN